MKKILTLFAVAAIVCSCGQSRARKEAEAAAQQARLDSVKQAQLEQKMKNTEELLTLLPEEPVFNVVTDLGTIKIKLYKDTPKHKINFARLALNGFYDGLLFHRVINGFMIQGGDPLTSDPANENAYGTGGPGYTVPAEITGKYKHLKGALAAARRGDAANPLRESSGSQFYIVQDERTCAQLDGDYTVFGQTVEGFDVIDAIASVETNYRDLPLNPVHIKKIELVPEE